MNKRYLQWLYGQLPELAGKGIITQQNAEQIKQYYEGLSISSKRPLALIIFGTIGTFLIGLGIILLFAHNWEQLSREARTVLSLMPTALGILLCGWVLFKKNDITALKESAATFLSLMVGASLALVCQTYHISGDSSDFIMTWMLLIVPLVYLMDATIPAVIYLAGITSWTYHFWGETLEAFLYWPLAAIVVPHFITSLRKEMHAVRSLLFALAAALSVFFVSFVMLNQKNLPGSWIIFHSGIFGIFYLIGKLDVNTPSRHWQAPFLFIGRIGILIMAFILTYYTLWDFNIFNMGNFSGTALLLNTVLLVGIMAIYALLAVRSQKSLEAEDMFYAAMPLMAILGCLFTYLVKPLSIVPVILFNVYILILSIRYITGGIKQGRLDKLNTGILILAVLIILRFFDIDIGFTFKGLTFIVLGIGFLAANIAMLRRREGRI
ncbi:MAG: DUF2157 domain-containing protein [Candidatus Omnitrophica bacterium]|nr:DUF2157 domain-containing protein [Candidatus Omnitrophota bacterium]